MFPGIDGRAITGAYAAFDADGQGPTSWTLDLGGEFTLRDRTLVATPGLSLVGPGPWDAALVAQGDVTTLRKAVLVLAYQAR
ncbi:hypothetical protein GCM10029964_062050 [Kibdelosporangium lantanae]